jgi:hypothetical protein
MVYLAAGDLSIEIDYGRNQLDGNLQQFENGGTTNRTEFA